MSWRQLEMPKDLSPEQIKTLYTFIYKNSTHDSSKSGDHFFQNGKILIYYFYVVVQLISLNSLQLLLHKYQFH